VLVIDYSNLKEAEMIEKAIAAKDLILTENKPVLLLSIYNDKGYATPSFMRTIEKETRVILHLIEKQAVTGLNDTKKILLKGYNFLFQKDIRNFNSLEEALDFLVDETTTDKNFPWK
jgi:hypothetical protein